MSAATWLYRRMIGLLPRPVREHDGADMARTFADQLAHSRRPRADAWRAFCRFPAVLVLEWRDALLAGSVPTQPTATRGSFMDSIARTLRQSARSLARTPAFSISVILLLGLGVGGVSAIFAVVDHVLLRGLPYPSSERLFVVENGSHSMLSYKEFASMKSVEAWAAATSDESNLTGQGDPLRMRDASVTDGFFPMFAARPYLGRLFQTSDFAAAEVAVLSYGTWIRVFGGDSSVVGRSIRVNERPLTVIGVLDENFAVPEAIVDASVDVWRPVDPGADYMNDRNYFAFSVAGRMRAGSTIKQIQQEATQNAEVRAKAFPGYYMDGGKVIGLPIRNLQEATTGDVKDALRILFGAVVVLLLVACANVTHLCLARGVNRSREMAVRRALGANTRTLVSQLLAESVLLGAVGAALGIALAEIGVRVFLMLMPDGLPRASTIGVDMRVAMFAAGIGMLTAIVFGLLPALRFTRASIGDPMRSSSRSATGGRAAQLFRHAIVVGEVALSLVLVAQAGWLIRSFLRVTHQDLGFQTQGIVTMPLRITGIKTAAEWNARLDAIRESLTRVGGVRDVAYGLSMPLEWVGGGRCCWGSRPVFAGKPPTARPSQYHPVSEDYFKLLNVRIVAGAAWTRAQTLANPAPAVISEELAKQTFGSAPAAIGALFSAGKTSFVVTGVAANTRHYGADQPVGMAVYMPANVIPFAPGRMAIAVRTDRVDGSLQSDLRAAVWRAEPNLPVPIIRSLADWSRADSARRRFDSLLFGTFSGVALLLVAGGLAGTLFYTVSLQRRSLGIRLALGATPRGLERGVLTRGVGMASIGVVIGTAGAWITGRYIESRLYGVEARDVRTLGIAVAVLMTIAALSSWLPARRAAGTNPLDCLRAD